MDFIDGEDLNNRIKKGAISFQEAVNIVIDVAWAIEHANQQGVIHRDIKPGNVLIDRKGGVKVTDFGLAKLCRFHDREISSAGEIIGTPHYMAPEQADSGHWGQIGPATDVYGLGALLYALLVGRPPVEGGTLTELFSRLTSEQPCASPRSIPPGDSQCAGSGLPEMPRKRSAEPIRFGA